MRTSQDDGRSCHESVATPSSADTTPEEAEAEMEALCATYEAQARREEGECRNGCDHPDGPLSPTGCRW